MELCLMDDGNAACTDNIVYTGEKPQIHIQAIDDENDISRISLELIHDGEIVYELIYRNSQEEHTWDGIKEWYLEIDRLAGPVGAWQARITVEDSNGSSARQNLDFRVMSLIDCITLVEWKDIGGKVNSEWELKSECSRYLDRIKFTIQAACTDGSVINHISAFLKFIPGETASTVTGIITNGKTITSLSVLPESIVVEVY